MKFCKKCLLPSTYPKLKINKKGVCNVCISLNKNKINKLEIENKLKIIFKNKKKVIVTVSGGKDSSYVLYLCKKIYNLDVVCANFDNGFKSKEAKINLKNVSKKFNVPIFYYRPNKKLLYNLYRHFLLSTGDFCTPCSQGCCKAGFKIAQKNKIKTIIHGGVAGSKIASNVLNLNDHSFKKYLTVIGNKKKDKKWVAFANNLNQINKFELISLTQIHNWDLKKIIPLLKEELNWIDSLKGSLKRNNNIDCLVYDARNHLLQKKQGFSKYWMDISANIRAGYLNIDDGFYEIIKKEKMIENEPKNEINLLLKKLNLTKKKLYSLPFYKCKPIYKELLKQKSRLLCNINSLS